MFDIIAKVWTNVVGLMPRAQRRWWRLWRRGYLIYVISCGLLAVSAHFSFRAGLTTHRRAEAARLALFSEHEPYRGDLYPGIAAAFTSSISVAATTEPLAPALDAPPPVDAQRWSVSCAVPALIARFADVAEGFQRELSRPPLPLFAIRLFGSDTHIHSPIGHVVTEAEWSVSTILDADHYRPATPPMFGETLAPGDLDAAPIVAFHVTTLAGTLILRPRPPEQKSSSAIQQLRSFNNTSYFMNTIDGAPATGGLNCGASKYPHVTDTRPYIDLAGMGFVATLCSPIVHPNIYPVVHPSGMALCADVRLPLRAVVAGLDHQGFADVAVVDVVLPDQADSPVEEARRVRGIGTLALPHRDLEAVAQNTTLRLFRDGTFKPGGARRKQLYGIVLGRRRLDAESEKLQLLVFRPKMLSASVGLDLVAAAISLAFAAALLVYAMRKVAARADEDARRSLQVGLLKTTLEGRGTGRVPFVGGVVARVQDDTRVAIAGAIPCASTTLRDAAAAAVAHGVLANAMHSLRTNFNAFERVAEANAIARTLLGEQLIGSLFGALGSDLVIERVAPGSSELRFSTYADVQARRANGHSSEYFQLQPDGSWLRFVGAPIREPDGSYQTLAIIERVDPDFVRRLDATYAFHARKDRHARIA